MSCPLSLGQIRSIISDLQRLESWLQEAERASSHDLPSQPRGYRLGGAIARASALSRIGHVPTPFPAPKHISQLWTLVEESGLEFSGRPFTCVEEGPGTVPAVCEDLADFISWDTREGLQAVHVAYSAGFFARASLETFTAYSQPVELSRPAGHFIVLRACSLGGFVRFGEKEHFDRFLQQAGSSDLIAHGFRTDSEVDVFCQGARVTLPPLFKPCQS